MMQDLMNKFVQNHELRNRGITIIEEEQEKFVSYQAIYEKALCYLKKFHDFGIHKGCEVLFQTENIEEFVYTFWACQMGCITAVPVDIGENAENIEKIFRIWKSLNNPFYLSQKYTFQLLSKHKDNYESEFGKIESRTLFYEDVTQNEIIEEFDINDHEHDYVSLIQYSSGSTGTPKGIPILYNSLSIHVNALVKRECVTSSDKMLNWAPLSHNLGLVSVHIVGIFCAVNQYLMSKQLFVRNPLLWMRKASEHKITMIYAPNFGYKYLLTHYKATQNEKWDLSNIRIAFNGAEPINYKLCREFVNTLKKYGLHDNVIYPAYGCSEATSVISIPEVGRDIKVYYVDRRYLNIGKQIVLCEKSDKNAIAFVSVGEPVDNCEVRVCDENNNKLENFKVGYLQVRGENVIGEYYNNVSATKDAFVENDWFNTGDLCFRDGESVVITGRAKEIIFVNGQNYYPMDIERVVEEEDERLIGKIACCGIFSEDIQTDKIYFFLEISSLSFNDFSDLKLKILKKVREGLGLYVEKVIPVIKLEKTQSGKMQRLKMEKQFIQGAYDSLLEKYGVIKEQSNTSGSDVKMTILNIWKEILNNNSISEEDNFFDLGGSSSLLILLTTKIEERFPDCISAIDIFEAPTVKELSKLVIDRIKE